MTRGTDTTICDTDAWKSSRGNALRRLYEDIDRGLVDPDIRDWLAEFNRKCEDVFTTSSCSGRLVIIKGRSLTDKKWAEILDETHDPDECYSNACRSISELPVGPGGHRVWASLQPPIIQFHVCSLTLAWRILDCSVNAGFIRSGVRKSKIGGFIVEARAYDKLHVLLPASCDVLLELCGLLREYKSKLLKLLVCLTDTCG